MKFDMNMVKILGMIVIMVGAVAGAINTLGSDSYSGANLTFPTAGSSITVVNPSDAGIAAQLLSTGARSFRVTSTADGIAGSSASEGTGTARVNTRDIVLPPGDTTFIVTGGSGVAFTAVTETILTATIQRVSEGTARVVMLGAIAIVLFGLYYISGTTNHALVKRLMGRTTPLPVVAAAGSDASQGTTLRGYGDNLKR